MATAIRQSGGSNISGFSAAVPVDKGFTRDNTPRIHAVSFGDGYEQRIANGINTLDQTMSVSFSTRPKAEIDDLVAFFESLGGVSKFEMIIDDTNGAETIKVTCKSWSQTWVYDDFYTLSASFQRCYEA
tara:strand:- start:1709 stop:2095 length:387 start_codon:yes stop_codon:yes gene_type:complete